MAYLPELYPWLNEVWSRTTESLDKLPHAMLVNGSEGIGKFKFASRLAMALLCAENKRDACGQCRNCRYVGAATHPDLHVLTSEAKLQFMDATMVSYAERYLDDERARTKRKIPRAAIVIAQIRALIEAANIKPHISENKVFVLDPVDSMTIAAANSLLKVLEEPPPNTYLILIAENDQHLLPTIISRCQSLWITDPEQKVTENWLAEQGVSAAEIQAIVAMGKGPLVGLRRAKDKNILQTGKFLNQVIGHLKNSRTSDIFVLVELGAKLGESECLDSLHLLVSKMISKSLVVTDEVGAEASDLIQLVNQVDASKLYSVYDHIGYLRNELRAGGMDKVLAVEDALFALHESVR